ncbi:MAG: PAS domain-containing protein [Gammaproteobacteria bacterium]|nr:PAS domain-containing protein [Gammaproteobacteria bacterium]NNM19856.1 PAS domain-containing protein [Gammaproteobacteria bacterium]
MLDALRDYFSNDQFMPHGMCFLWRPDVLWTHVASDVTIALAYFSIPLALIYFARRRGDLGPEYNWIFRLFAAFILFCGMTHLMGVWVLWNPDYIAQGYLKATTALVSLATAVALWPLVPRAAALPHPRELQNKSAMLAEEVAERRRAEGALQRAQAELESRVDRRTAELAAKAHELNQTNRFLDSVLEHIPSVILVKDARDLSIVGLNDAALKLIGKPREQIIGRTEDAFLSEAAANISAIQDRQVAETGLLMRVQDHHMPTPTGERIFETRKVAIAGDDGKTQFILQISDDLTQRKGYEERFRMAVESSPAGMVMTNEFGVIEMVNEEATRLFGYPRNELLGAPIEQLVPNEVRKGHPELRDSYHDKPQARRIGAGRELHGRRKDGDLVPVEIGLTPIDTDEGTLVLSAIVDITGRKEAEQAVRTSEAQLRLMANSLPVLIAYLTTDRELQFANTTLGKWCGIDPSAIGTSGTSSILDSLARADGCDRALAGERHRETRRIAFPDGERDIELMYLPNVNEQGEVEGVYLLGSDITEQRQVYDELTRANEELARSNAELDDFAYIASHDLKEPLRGIHNYAAILLEDHAADLGDEGADKLHTLVRLSKRLELLISSLLEYSRTGRTELAIRPTDLNEVVSGVIDSLRISLEQNNATVTVHDLPVMTCDSVRIGEVYVNLISNAMRYNDKDAKQIEVGADTSGEQPVLFVRDDGIGMHDRHQQSIFRIFKRLHPRDSYGGGSGAGLTIAKKIVERHGGRIWVESSPGAGSTFYFTLG